MYAGADGHYGYPDFPSNRNIGGRFFLNSFEAWAGTGDVGTIKSGSSRYIGGFAGTWPGISKLPGSSWVPLSADSSDAYNKMKPAQPDFSALNAIYELKDLPRMLSQRLSHNGLKDIGDYYLALKFGWEPLLRDIRNFVHTQRNAQKRLKQLLRDNGKPVRRACVVRESSSTTTTSGASYGALRPTISTGFYVGTPTWESKVTHTERVWASGRFRYWLPGGPRDVAWQRKMLARIYGFRPSPKVVWDAMPWTWLADWFVDVGSMLENMDPGVADRLAADYCYIMRELSDYGTRETIGFFDSAITGKPVKVSVSGTAHAKLLMRDPGSPFGWNVNEPSLSGAQLGILGALGLSRLPR